MALQANNRNGTRILLKNDRSMPAWVTEQSGRIGPKPPPPPLTPENGHAAPAQPQLPPKSKSQPEPDYEVIEFSNQQYSNAPLRPSSASSGSKTPDSKVKCTLCGSNSPWVTCEQCSQQIFCASCDDMYHKHPKRKDHQRKTLEQTNPPLPPKLLPGQPGPAPPVAPPRRNKRGLMTPLMQRKDQVNANVGTFVIPPSPTPSMRNGDWHGRNDTLKRNSSMFNRPLPETPKTPTTPSESSRPGTPKSVFDNIQKQPSVVLEKIKHKANATLDRMQLLQQRYRQQKEQMERDRCGSSLDQNVRSFDQWSSISPSPSHFRSGSISSGMNSSHLDLTEDSSFNMFHQRQLALQHHQMAAQRANQLGQRGMSSSVFNLNQMHRKPPVTNNGWMNNSMQQAQSMAQLNCANCTHPPQPSWGGHQHMHMPHPDPWSNHLSSQQQLNRSNLSLNIGAGYMMQPPHNGMYPPPVFMNQRNGMGQMYPQPYMGGMPVMNPGLSAMPPSASRAASRAGSRMGSPAMSRKSVTLRRKQRSSYIDDAGTDDEDSDEDDRRSIVSNRSGVSRSRQRRLSSASQFQLDEDVDAAAAKLQRSRVRSQRRDSIAKSVHNDWAPGRKASASNNKSVDSGFNSPLKPSRIYSDLDSEGSGTRALVQAKIEQKLKEGTLKEQKQTKAKRRSESPPKQKTSAAVQTPAAHPKKEKEDKLIVQASESEEEYEVVEEEVTDDDENEAKEKEVPQTKSPEPPNTNGPSAEQLELPAEDEDAVSLGPPPSTPDQEWECEFCTFVNEPNIKICTICCKTPCGPPKLVGKSASPPKQVKSAAVAKDKSEDTEDTKVTTTATSSSSTFINTLKKKETVDDVWANLDEDIQATAHEVTRKAESAGHKPTKVSTGCGTSSKSASIERQADASNERSQAREIGTSPPPQTISTQTYEALPLRKSETKEEHSQMSAAKTPQPSANEVIQQSANFPLPNKIHDMKSFENEVLNNIHNISHVPMSQYQHHPYYNPHERHQRYRSNNDLRMDDTMSLDYDSFNGMGRRHPSIGELLLLQRTSSQMHSPLAGSSYDLSYRHNGMDHHKESDLYKHTTEELNAALKYCGPDMHPLIWLRDNWPKLIQTVQSLATKYGQERAENTIGTISQMEAREALRMHTGNIWQAVSECIEQRQRKYREISSRGNFSREDVVTALTTHQGNVDLALMDLGRTQLKPFLMRIWGSPGGVENESGSMTIAPPTSQSSQSTPYTMDKDIHSFLSANASDCMQIPNTTGAFTPTNQMPSPFDLPASLVNPYDINNPMPDNTSSYSADSKDYAPSPLQIDDTILNNKSMLKDLETLIGTMEQNQQKQNEQVLRSIQDMISNLKHDKPEDEFDTETMRILTKSPITNSKLKNPSKDKAVENEADVKSFMWQHIQEIMPNLVQQVEMELLEDHVETEPLKQEEEVKVSPTEQEKTAAEPAKELPPPPPPIDQDEFLMEEVIKPNLKQASIREELPPQYVYASEIATFQMTFDKGLARPHKQEFQFNSLREASREIFKMYKAPEAPKQPMSTEVEANIQATLEIIPATVSALSATPEPHKLSPSPIIPLTIEEVVGQAAVNGNARRLAQPPEIPPFEDLTLETAMIQTVADNASTEAAAYANKLDSTAAENDTQEMSHTSQNQSGAFIAAAQPLLKDAAEMQQASNHITLPHTELATVSSTAAAQTSTSSRIESKDASIDDASTIASTKSESLPSVAVSPEPTTSTETTNTTETSFHSEIMTSQESSIMGPTMATQSNSISELANLLASISSEDSPSSNTSVLSNTALEAVNTSESQQSMLTETIVQSISQSNNNSVPESSQASAIAVSTALPTPIQNNSLSEPVINSDISSQDSILAPTDENQNHANHQITPHNEKAQAVTVLADITSSVTASTKAAVTTPSRNDPKTTHQPEVILVNTTESPAALQTVLNPTITEKVPSPAVDNTNSNQRKTSKIPVRRTASNKSLILNPTTTATPVQNQKPAPQQKPTQQDAPAAVQVQPVESMDTPSTTDNIISDHKHDNDSEDEELYSLASETSADYDSRTDELQSPISTNEVFLMIHQDNGESTVDDSTIIPSTSSSTLHSVTSYSSGLKSPGEFVPSGDPSKQNLSELVMDTQRLIKQMKEEINIDDFESSTDDDYTDEYSDEYDDEDDEELGEEEEDDEDWEDEEEDELDDAMDDLTEEDELAEEQLVHTPKLSDTPDDRNEHNTSQLSNVSESSKHSLPSLSSEHPVNDHITSIESVHSISNSNEESMVYVETEGQLSELPVESVLSDIGMREPQPTMAFVESENASSEMPVESVLHTTPSDATATGSSDTNRTEDENVSKLTSIPLAIGSVIEAENALPELPAETVLMPVTESLPLQTENTIAELPTEVVLPPAELIVIETPSSHSNERPQTPSKPDTQITTSSSPESLPLNNIHNIPSTSGSVLSSTEPTANVTTAKPAAASVNLTEQTASKDKPSTSKGAKAKVADPKKATTDGGVGPKVVTKKPVSASKIPKPKETAKEPKLQQAAADKEQKTATAHATKIQKSKETAATPTRVQIEPKRKMPTRSKSFSGPPTPIGISSVKTITQKYLNQTQPTKNQTTAPKAPTTVARKPSITEAINRLTKPATSTELPSTSSLFRTRTQPRIPKKKYHETCFSDDDYETTSSEEELEPLEIRQRKMSIPVFRAYPSVQEPEEVNQEELVDKFVKEELVSNIAEAQIAAALVAMKFQQDVSLWAAKECSDLDHAVALLRQECELCSGTYALNEIVSMLKCTHKCCKQCAKTYFTVQITERSINDCNCPFCKQPELNNQTEHEDENLEYFSNLDIYLKNIVEPEVHELFQRKLRDRTLLKDPNFKWCVQCSSGFFARPKQKRLICPDCGSVTCALCRKTWQKQHEGISCEKFLEWEMGNDPEVQDLGVKEHLEQNGIDCPKCKFKYSLARGGCMHFTCTQCKFEFCYGCARPFMMGAKCTISPYCAKLGLHAHHPRNCLFYLRDKLPVQLQILLKNNGVAFEVDPIETTPSEEEPGTSQKKPALCPIPIQKETPTGLMDTKCNSEVPDKHAGMCRTHYVEYLTAKVAKANIDPLPIFDLTDCVQELRRRGIPLPERGPWDTDEIYKGMCSEVIQKSIPLDVN